MLADKRRPAHPVRIEQLIHQDPHGCVTDQLNRPFQDTLAATAISWATEQRHTFPKLRRTAWIWRENKTRVNRLVSLQQDIVHRHISTRPGLSWLASQRIELGHEIRLTRYTQRDSFQRMVGIAERETMRWSHSHNLAVTQSDQEPMHYLAIRLIPVPCPPLQADRPCW